MTLVVSKDPQHVWDIEVIEAEWVEESPYRKYFDFEAARVAFYDHIASKPGYRTEEKHTLKSYERGLKYFLDWLGVRLPDQGLMKAFIRHLVDRGLKASTIASGYLAPARLYCKLLSEQPLGFRGEDAAKMFELSMALPEVRNGFRLASEVANPAPETTTRISGLFDPRFHRLTVDQVKALLRACDVAGGLAGMRNRALLHTAFTTALRVAEIQRMTLNSLRLEGEVWLVTVRGKRSNIDPVTISKNAVRDIKAWVAAYNEAVGSPNDPLWIGPDTPLWQPLMHGAGRPLDVGHKGFQPERGMTTRAIQKAIGVMGKRVLDIDLAAHDTRRTAAAIAYDKGMDLTEIQKMLRHKDAATTLRYIGVRPDWGAASMDNIGVNFG